jgi:thiosulfate/3-mercaptopyruvate sulfurtransferase
VFWDTRKEVDAGGRFRSAADFGGDFAAVAAPDEPLVAYCGGGGRAARTFVALQLAGYTQAAVYPASWNEWGNQDNLPIETGAPQATAA